MKRKFTLSNAQRQRRRLYKASAAGIGLLVFVSVLYYAYSSLLSPKQATAQTAAMTTFQGGSYIINMGLSPQTVGNGLKPYGLVYDLVVNSMVPVAWVINPSKTKDQIDFAHEGFNYRGGTFVVPGEYVTAEIQTKIMTWQLQGVTVRRATNAFSAPLYEMITSYPRVMIDSLSNLQNVIVSYFDNAGIPSTAYRIGSPATLTSCFDVWANPHGDPIWSTHFPLYNFVTVNKGFVYAQCHSVSMLENCVTGNPISNQLNFLTLNGMKCWKASGCEYAPETHSSSPTAPFTYAYPADPIMQFISTMHTVSSGGSEQYYIPLSTGGWRPTTRVGVSTTDGVAPKQGTVLVYGPAYGNANYGHVLYIGGHTLISGTATDQIAAQRAFHNFMLRAAIEKKLQISAVMPPENMPRGASTGVSVTVTNGSPGYTYQWTSSLGGTFTDATAASTTYTSPMASSTDTVDIVRIRVTDACGRSNFITQVLRISGTLPVGLVDFNGQNMEEGILLKWTTATEINNDHFIVDRSKDGSEWNFLGRQNGTGNSSSLNSYSLKDREPQKGINYYRLTQVDYDGRSETLRTISVRFNGKDHNVPKLDIKNNLFSTTFDFLFEAAAQMNASLKLFDATGRLADQRHYLLQKGSQVLTYNESGLKIGMYLVVFEAEDGTALFSKVVKL